jgi:PIN domain
MSVLICLDTSSLSKGGLQSAKLRELLAEAARLEVAVCVTPIILEEWAHASTVRIRESLRKLREHAAEIGRMLGREPLDVEAVDLQVVGDRLRETHRRWLAEAGVRTIASADLDLGALLEQSLTHLAPFSEGDRGFRDAAIVEAALAHAAANGLTRVLFVTEDGAWAGVNDRAARANLAAQAVGLDGAQDVLKGLLQALHAERIGRLQPKALAFLEANRETVFAHVRQLPIGLAVIEDALHRIQGYEEAELVEIGPVQPYAFGTVYPSPYPPVEFPGRYGFAFTVESQVDVVVRKPRYSIGVLFGPPIALDRGLTAQELADVKREFYRQTVGYEHETVTVKELGSFVRATVTETGAADEQYADLRILEDSNPSFAVPARVPDARPK